MADRLYDQHLAALHALAAQAAVPRFRMLRRPELIAELEARREGSDATPPPPAAPAGERTDEERADEEPTEEVAGVLEITPQRYGLIRLRGLEDDPDDVYVSASQVRRCELRTGDEVSGPARAPRRGERHRALVHVDRVNGGDPQAERREFERLTPIVPRRRLAAAERGDVLTRAVDLLAPLAFGQRVLIQAAPRSGRTTLLRGLARAITAEGDVDVIVLLIDERPEEATIWREQVDGAEIASATAELAPREQVRVAALALERSQRRAEAGRDVVLLADSLSRLAVAAEGVVEVKRLFGSGRDLAEGGSLTVIATVVEDADDDGAAERAVLTTESSLVKLDASLAAAGVVPALRAAECRTSNEEELRGPEELAAARRLRSLLADLGPAEAASLLRERIEGSPTNRELLEAL